MPRSIPQQLSKCYIFLEFTALTEGQVSGLQGTHVFYMCPGHDQEMLHSRGKYVMEGDEVLVLNAVADGSGGEV